MGMEWNRHSILLLMMNTMKGMFNPFGLIASRWSEKIEWERKWSEKDERK